MGAGANRVPRGASPTRPGCFATGSGPTSGPWSWRAWSSWPWSWWRRCWSSTACVWRRTTLCGRRRCVGCILTPTTHTQTQTQTHTLTHTHAHTCARTYIHTQIQELKRAFVGNMSHGTPHTQIHRHTDAHVDAHTHARRRTHTCTHRRTRAHTSIQTRTRVLHTLAPNTPTTNTRLYQRITQ